MSWLIVILAVIFLYFLYLKFMKNKKLNTPSLNLNFADWLYPLGLAVVFWFLIPNLFPVFWAKYYGSDLFWPTVLIGILCLYMWSQKYFLFMVIFFAILIIVLSRFSGLSIGKEKKTNSIKTVVVWKINSSNDSTLVYNGDANVRLNLPQGITIRITPACGTTVSILSLGWDHAIILKGCSLGTVYFPTMRRWVDIRSIK